ncbi:MAG: MBL fold metallo-hydrolase [Gemmatimonadaceae bacterium]
MSSAPNFEICRPNCGPTIDVEFLGVAGFLIRAGHRAILTGPLFTRPNLLEVINGMPYVADTAVIDSIIRAHHLSADLHSVRAILVGHSHYDHLMDVPYIAEKYADSATIYGTPTMGHILAGYADLGPVYHFDPNATSTPQRGVAVIDEKNAGDSAHSGDWVHVEEPSDATDSGSVRFRFMALRSSHATNFAHLITLFPDTLHKDDSVPPTLLSDWKGGETYAYMIDVVGAHSAILFRIYYRDTSGDMPNGYPPIAALDSARVDLAIICAGNFDQARDYPRALIRYLNPKLVLAAHWDDFFVPASDRPKPFPTMNGNKFSKEVDAALPVDGSWFAPEPFTQFHFYIHH